MTALSRRSTGRIIALGASLTVALAGSAALATAASAEPGKGQGQGQGQSAESGKPAENGKPAETGGNEGGNPGGGNAGGNDGGSKPGQEVCGPLDSGKIDYSGGTVTVTAPAGNVITGYCVKAGSDQSTTDGAVQYVTLAEADRAQSVTFGHYSGKSISHYSYSWGPGGTPVEPVITKEYWKTCLADNSVATYERTLTDGIPGAWTPALAAGVVPGNGNGTTNPNAVLTCGGGGTVITIDETPTEVAASIEATAAESSAPEAVNAVAPANVAKPAPATVAVPAAATLPAAVPAGEGSDAPILPTWALAMIALGTLGAAVAGKQLVKNN